MDDDSRDDLNARDQSEHPLEYASEYHAPVLCNAVVKGLITNTTGTYVDGTLGGGGHAAAILDGLMPDARVIGLDQDREAIKDATARLKKDPRFQAVEGNFSDLSSILKGLGIDEVDGLLLDLGVSSHQFNEAQRGFSHRNTGPLDMRMDPKTGVTAGDILNGWPEADLVLVMRQYGEEPRARTIARNIVSRRPLSSTQDLAEVVRISVHRTQTSKALARVFQSIRIAVNHEIDALESVLVDAVDFIRPGGRIVVISYHSLEDRRVKRFLRSGNFEGKIHRDFYGVKICPWNEITRKPIGSSDEEQQVNPRSRSARLRIAERAR